MSNYDQARALEASVKTVEMCKCGKNPASPEMFICPYQEEINDVREPTCNCCAECASECAADI